MSSSSAPEARERDLALLRAQPGPLVTHGQAGLAVCLLDGDLDSTGLRTVELGVLDQVRDGTLERGAVAAHARRPGDDVDVGGFGCACEVVQSDDLAWRCRGLLARECEQVIGETREARGVLLEVGDELGRGTVTCEMGNIAAQGRQRRTQLMRGIGEKATLALPAALEAREHRVQRLGEATDLVARQWLRQAVGGVAGPRDPRGALGQVAERPECAPHHQRDSRPGKRSRTETGGDEENSQARKRALQVVRRGRHDHGSPSGRPSEVGQRSGIEPHVLVSELSGRGNILAKAREFGMQLDRDDPHTRWLVQHLKELEHRGYSYEAADASFEMLLRRLQPGYEAPWQVADFTTMVRKDGGAVHAEATVKVDVGGTVYHTAASGNGPVNALDAALRKALSPRFPGLKGVSLHDYKVRILDGAAGTAATTRVLIESGRGLKRWTTVGCSSNIIEASLAALVDSFEYAQFSGKTQKP